MILHDDKPRHKTPPGKKGVYHDPKTLKRCRVNDPYTRLAKTVQYTVCHAIHRQAAARNDDTVTYKNLREGKRVCRTDQHLPSAHSGGGSGGGSGGAGGLGGGALGE